MNRIDATAFLLVTTAFLVFPTIPAMISAKMANYVSIPWSAIALASALIIYMVIFLLRAAYGTYASV